MSHRNAPSTETGRLRLARCIVEQGWPLRRAAERFQVSVTYAARWASRYRDQGKAGMTDRPNRPRSCPRRLRRRREHRIVNLRVLRRQPRPQPVRAEQLGRPDRSPATATRRTAPVPGSSRRNTHVVGPQTL